MLERAQPEKYNGTSSLTVPHLMHHINNSPFSSNTNRNASYICHLPIKSWDVSSKGSLQGPQPAELSMQTLIIRSFKGFHIERLALASFTIISPCNQKTTNVVQVTLVHYYLWNQKIDFLCSKLSSNFEIMVSCKVYCYLPFSEDSTGYNHKKVFVLPAPPVQPMLACTVCVDKQSYSRVIQSGQFRIELLTLPDLPPLWNSLVFIK